MNKRYELCYKGDQDLISVFNPFSNNEVEFEAGVWREVDKDFYKMVEDTFPGEFECKEVVVLTLEQRLTRIEKVLNDIKEDLQVFKKGGMPS